MTTQDMHKICECFCGMILRDPTQRVFISRDAPEDCFKISPSESDLDAVAELQKKLQSMILTDGPVVRGRYLYYPPFMQVRIKSPARG